MVGRETWRRRERPWTEPRGAITGSPYLDRTGEDERGEVTCQGVIRRRHDFGSTFDQASRLLLRADARTRRRSPPRRAAAPRAPAAVGGRTSRAGEAPPRRRPRAKAPPCAPPRARSASRPARPPRRGASAPPRRGRRPRTPPEGNHGPRRGPAG